MCTLYLNKKKKKKGRGKVRRGERIHSNNLAGLGLWMRLRVGDGVGVFGRKGLLNPEEGQGEAGEVPGRAQLPGNCSHGFLWRGLLAGNTSGDAEACHGPESLSPGEKPGGNLAGGAAGLNPHSLWGTGCCRDGGHGSEHAFSPRAGLGHGPAKGGGRCWPRRGESSERKEAKVAA